MKDETIPEAKNICKMVDESAGSSKEMRHCNKYLKKLFTLCIFDIMVWLDSLQTVKE